MWGRGSVENMYRKGERQTVYFWKGTGGQRGRAGNGRLKQLRRVGRCGLLNLLALSLSLSLFLKGKGEWRGISLRKEGKKQTVYMGRG